MLKRQVIFSGQNKTQNITPSDFVYARRAAFSLIEIMVVLFIISLGLVGILSLISQNLHSQSYNENNLVAYQLAQEGVELIRKVRDTNWRSIPVRVYNYGLTGNNYYMDFNDDYPTILSSNSSADLLRQDSEGFYKHDLPATATSSGFYRSIFIKETSPGTMFVGVTVRWAEREQDRSYTLDTYLYDWKNQLFNNNP